ncbi:VOC family protein [Flavisolibacter tropicus]|nr:VOC family protein [Flavisolibacter tropicus]
MNRMDLPLLQGIDTVIVRVSNIEVSKDWYINKLGLSSIWDDPKMKLVVLDTKSPTSLTLWQTDQSVMVNRETASYPIFRTPDAEALRQELLSRGVEAGAPIQDDHVKYFFFYDPDGNVLEACQVHE